jgi:hypothetical protein
MARAMLQRACADRWHAPEEVRVLTEARRVLAWSYALLYFWEAAIVSGGASVGETNAMWLLVDRQAMLEIATEQLSDLVTVAGRTQADPQVQDTTVLVSSSVDVLVDLCALWH